jgi:DNA repair protein RecN (Recombination protein N)
MGYKVACKLANISKAHQVMSVSHLPQICAMADNNILVQKSVMDGQTFVSTKTLDADEKLIEIARLSGGEINSKASIEHAKYLKEKCNEYKKSIQ